MKYILKEQHDQIKNHSVKIHLSFFIGCRHEGNTFPSPLYIKLPQMNEYTKYFDKNDKYMNLLVKDEKTLKKYLKIWNKIFFFLIMIFQKYY